MPPQRGKALALMNPLGGKFHAEVTISTC